MSLADAIRSGRLTQEYHEHHLARSGREWPLDGL